MAIQVGPTKTETVPNRTKPTYAKRKSSPLNSHLGCQSLGLISLLAVASGYRLWYWGYPLLDLDLNLARRSRLLSMASNED